MPAKIDINLVYEALFDKLKMSCKTQKRYTFPDFTRLVKGASIASSKNAIETLWYQLLESDANIYDGPSENLALVDLGRLEELLYPSAHTLTHTHTHTPRVGVKN